MNKIVSGAFMIVGLIHLLPVSGVLGTERLTALYGIPFTDPNLIILMRHRAVLFGLLGVFFVVAAFRPAYQPAAFAAGFVSVVSFLWLAWSAGNCNASVGRVFWADVVALACLLAATVAYAVKHRSP